MKLSRLLSLSMTLAGTAAAVKVLAKRREWENKHSLVSICVDFDDLFSAATRAGLPLDEMLSRAAKAGATHVSLPELTLKNLLSDGRLAPRGPKTPLISAPPVGHWNYLFGEKMLLGNVKDALLECLPFTKAQILKDGTLAFAGDLITVGEIGLGFDSDLGGKIKTAGLGVVPRPVSYSWPDKSILERTIAQAAQLGKWIAFDGKMVLGHEMHLDETIDAMEKDGLGFVYFAETRHQRGDWFVAKKRAPNIVLAHQFTREEMMGMDFHAAANNWVHFAKERGVRFCYLNFFRELHATAPLEGLQYIAQLKKTMEAEGFVVTDDPVLPGPIPKTEPNELAQIGLAAAGIAATAVSQTLGLPETLAVPLAITAAGGAMALPYLEKSGLKFGGGHSHDHHDHDHSHIDEHEHDHPHADGHDHDHDHADEHDHPHADEQEHDHPHDHDHDHDHDHGHHHHSDDSATSYAPKFLALASASLAPVLTASLSKSSSPKVSWVANLISQIGAAASLAAVMGGKDYKLRIENYRGMNLDWLIPLSSAALSLPNTPLRVAAIAGVAGAWGLANQRGLDPLAQLDPAHPEGHTHHISAAQRLIGDTMMIAGPRPARKWFGVAPLASALGLVLRNSKQPWLSTAAVFASAAGNMLGLVGFRRPERAIDITLKEAAPSFAVGSAVGLMILLLGDGKRE